MAAAPHTTSLGGRGFLFLLTPSWIAPTSALLSETNSVLLFINSRPPWALSCGRRSQRHRMEKLLLKGASAWVSRPALFLFRDHSREQKQNMIQSRPVR